MKAATEAAATDGDHLLELMRSASAESLEANFRRFVVFRGWAPDETIELQALHVPGPGKGRNLSAHATSVDAALRLLAEMEARKPTAIYVIPNRIHPAVATRQAPDRWSEMERGSSTSDDEITDRTMFVIDFDFQRPKNTSTTTAELAEVLEVAARAQHFIDAAIGRDATVLGMSGNGCFAMLRLADLPSTDEVKKRARALLLGLQGIFETKRVKVDTSVSDPKRLIPAWGTTKRKGAPGVASRPHRRTCILNFDEPHRCTLEDIDRLLECVRLELTPEKCIKFDAERGIKALATLAPSVAPTVTESPFAQANRCDITSVLLRLGKLDGMHPVCVGCGLSGDSSVAIVGNGLKCSHNRCSSRGKGGFRTPVDCVAEVRGCSPFDAVRQLGEWFGFAVETRTKPTTHVRAESPLDEAVRRGDRKRALEVALGLYRRGVITHAEAMSKLSEIRS